MFSTSVFQPNWDAVLPKSQIHYGQGPGKADNSRAGSWGGGQLAGRAQGRRTTGGQKQKTNKNGGQLAGRVQGSRTTGGFGPGKADNWRARSREGGQLVGTPPARCLALLTFLRLRVDAHHVCPARRELQERKAGACQRHARAGGTKDTFVHCTACGQESSVPFSLPPSTTYVNADI